MNEISWDKWLDMNENFIDDYIQEAYWCDSFGAERLAELLIDRAADRDLTIYDLYDADVFGTLEHIYEITEKGLS